MFCNQTISFTGFSVYLVNLIKLKHIAVIFLIYYKYEINKLGTVRIFLRLSLDIIVTISIVIKRNLYMIIIIEKLQNFTKLAEPYQIFSKNVKHCIHYFPVFFFL